MYTSSGTSKYTLAYSFIYDIYQIDNRMRLELFLADLFVSYYIYLFVCGKTKDWVS